MIEELLTWVKSHILSLTEELVEADLQWQISLEIK